MSKIFFTLLLFIVAAVIVFLLFPAVNVNPGLPKDKLEIHALKSAMEIYKLEYAQYPTGNIEEIVSTLSGGNPKKIIFLDWNSRPTGERENVVDPWGTPYRINTVSNEVFVTCAGPDKKFGTDDDRSTK
jgi:hypothetical protein